MGCKNSLPKFTVVFHKHPTYYKICSAVDLPSLNPDYLDMKLRTHISSKWTSTLPGTRSTVTQRQYCSALWQNETLRHNISGCFVSGLVPDFLPYNHQMYLPIHFSYYGLDKPERQDGYVIKLILNHMNHINQILFSYYINGKLVFLCTSVHVVTEVVFVLYSPCCR